MRVDELIKALGGTARVAAAAGVHPSAVSHWIAADAIPARRVFAVWELALDKGVNWRPPGAPAPTEAASS